MEHQQFPSTNAGLASGPLDLAHALASALFDKDLLPPNDLKAVKEGMRGRLRSVPQRRDIIREGEVAQHAVLVIEGWAARQTTLSDGRRQIVSLLLPGDLYDLDVLHADPSDHALTALTPVSVVELSRERIRHILAVSPRVAQALLSEALAAAAIQQEWTVNLGQRTALERIAHLFCELFWRLRAIGRATDDQCEMPLTQTDLADATGLTSVHVNRTLQELRGTGLIVLKGRQLVIPDLGRLQRLCLFTGAYLKRRSGGRRQFSDRY